MSAVSDTGTEIKIKLKTNCRLMDFVDSYFTLYLTIVMTMIVDGDRHWCKT